jgi:dTDP-4-dehydrorhamnose reductase
MRLLVTGAAGQLGSDVVATAEGAGDDVLAADRSVVDITDGDAVAELLATWRPDTVVNCAAWTAVDACEGDPGRAHAVNSQAVRWLAEACDRVGAHLMQVSTEYVFDGTSSRPYREDDETGPLSVYGSSKLGGERQALALGPSAAVVRTSWVCGQHGSNMVRTVLRLLHEQRPLAFVDDQRGCPTFTTDLAPVLLRIAQERRHGLHHATNEGAVSWFEFVRDIVAAAGGDPSSVTPISTEQLDPPRPARRPALGVLDNAVLRAAGWPPPRDFREPLGELVRALAT